MRRTLVVFGAAALLLAGCSDSGAGQVRTGDVESPSEVLGDADEGIEGVQAIRVFYESPVHAEGDIDYGLRPPAGGLHAPIWWNCGFYDAPVRDENVGHDLEHGVVWLAYAPDLDPQDVEVVHDIVRANDKVLAAPYEGLKAGVAVVATAWARQLTLDSVNDPRLEAFVERYQDGDQAPEAGASCTGSPLGEPIP
jgi:hypothetical protein